MKFSYNWLKELVDFKESPQELAELLTLHAFEYETIEKIGNDWAIDVKIPANRLSDAAGHVGLAREISVILKKPLKIPVVKKGLQKKGGTPIKTKISSSLLSPRYTAQELLLKNLSTSPKWLQDKLITCGFRPIDAVVDVTNYIMLELGQPMHAFDAGKIQGRTMAIREAKAGEELTTLDGTKHKLPPGAIIIEDENRIIDLAGIMGGENSAVDSKTRRILLQAAVFDPIKIYKTIRDLKFASAAAKIYSSGIDINGTRFALERAVELLREIAQAEEAALLTDIYPKKVMPTKIKFRSGYADKLIGQSLGENFYKKTFAEFGFKTAPKVKDLLVEVPTYRQDLNIEEDLIEEAVRIFGYEKIKSEMPEAVLVPPVRNEELWWEERIKDDLVAAGFSEYLPYEFAGEEFALFQIDPEKALELANPISGETKYLVPRVLIKYISATAENLRNFETVRLFGIAKSFAANIPEHKDLIICLSKKGTGAEEEFYQLKGTLDQIFENLGISDYWYDDAIEDKSQKIKDKSLALFHPYRVAEIKVGDEKIGNLGEIHPVIQEGLKTKARMVAAEIDFEKLWSIARAEHEFRPIGKYPAIIRDLALIVPEDVKADQVQEIIENIGGALLIDADLFDYFQDEQMQEAEEKSLAFHLTFQSPERTLKDGEVNTVIEKIIKALEEQDWEVRK